jgi:uncharacterized protein YkwD
MTRFPAVYLLFVLFSANASAQKETRNNPLPVTCLSQVETELFRLINEYRSQKGLPGINLSASLSYVAKTHAKDQTENFSEGSRCNMHSWSGKGEWSSCCYTADHKKAKCMWDKPRELTGYQGDGFEISFYSTYLYPSPAAFANDILDGWKKSPGHNDMIINKGIWKNVRWKSVGIGIYGEYANVWFGREEDSAGEPGPCE